jgi:hypothetical protein
MMNQTWRFIPVLSASGPMLPSTGNVETLPTSTLRGLVALFNIRTPFSVPYRYFDLYGYALRLHARVGKLWGDSWLASQVSD